MRARGRRATGKRRSGGAGAGLWLGALAAVLAACSAPPPRGNLQYVEQDTFRIENPSPDRALATGIGCAFTVGEAETRAREIATFNLRRLTGNAHYRVEYSRLRETPEDNQVCVEYQAQAIPPRFR
jgi:hypothetical protein